MTAANTVLGPVAGVEVGLARYGGAQFAGGGLAARTGGDGAIRQSDPIFQALRATTDGAGAFSFPVVPEGSYALTVAPPSAGITSGKHEMSKNAIGNIRARTTSMPATGGANTGAVTIIGGRGGTKTVGWSFETNRAIDVGVSSSAKLAGGEDKIVVESDGVHPISGTIAQQQ